MTAIQKNPVIRDNSAWSVAQIRQFLRETEIPVRLGCLSVDGEPLVCSLWYWFDKDTIWCATPKSARLTSLLERHPRCAFEVAGDLMPYRGVRGRGRVTLSAADGPAILLRLIDRYLNSRDSGFAQWLIARQADELAIRVEPEWWTAWDFSARMNR